MNNIEKKLDALIDALGFDVETTLDYKERKLTIPTKNLPNEYHLARNAVQGFLIDDDGMYTARLKSPVIDYKLTKKEDPLLTLYDGVTLNELVRNVYDHAPLEKEYRWIEYPKIQFDAVIDIFGVSVKSMSYNKDSCKILGVEVSVNENI